MGKKIENPKEAYNRIMLMMKYQIGKTLNEQRLNEVDPTTGWEGQNRYKSTPTPLKNDQRPEYKKHVNTPEGKIAQGIYNAGKSEFGTDDKLFLDSIQRITDLPTYNKVTVALRDMFNTTIENEIKKEYQFNMSYDQVDLENVVKHLKKIGVPVTLNKVNNVYDKKTFKIGDPANKQTDLKSIKTASFNPERIKTIALTMNSVVDNKLTKGVHQGITWDEYRKFYQISDEEVNKAVEWLKNQKTQVNKPSLPVAKSEEDILKGVGYLYKGTRNSQAIAGIQAQLGLKQDGIFGSETDSAVRNFQKQNGLRVDGIVGPKTMKALINARNSNVKISTPNTSSADDEVNRNFNNNL